MDVEEGNAFLLLDGVILASSGQVLETSKSRE